MTWNEVQYSLTTNQRCNWFDIAIKVFNQQEKVSDWEIMLDLMCKAEVHAGSSRLADLLLSFSDYSIALDYSEEAYDYLLGMDVYSIGNADLIRKYYQLAYQFNEPYEFTKSIDWLRQNGCWLKKDEEMYLQCCTNSSMSLLKKDSSSNSITNPIRTIGQSLGQSLSGRKPSVFSFFPETTSLPASLAMDDINKMSGYARQDMKKILTKISGSTTSKVFATGLDAAVEQYLWLGQLDHNVLQAISFASAGNSQAFDHLLEATNWFEEGLIQGNLPRLYGYVAEQQTMVHLLQQGHQVELAGGATQPGWDLLVDGQEFQVKHTLSASLIESHFEKYPDIPVIVNSELAAHYENDDRVWIDYERIHPDTVSDTVDTLSSLQQGGAAGSIVLNLMMAGIRHINHPESKNKFLENTTKDFLPSIICTKGGAALLASLAAMSLGPVGVATATVLGAMFGNGVGDSIGKAWINSSNQQRNDEACEQLINFARWMAEGPHLNKLDAVERSRNKMLLWDKEARALSVPSSISSYWRSVSDARSKQINYFGDVLDQNIQGGEESQIKAGWIAFNQSGYFADNQMREKIRKITTLLATIKNK